MHPCERRLSRSEKHAGLALRLTCVRLFWASLQGIEPFNERAHFNPGGTVKRSVLRSLCALAALLAGAAAAHAGANPGLPFYGYGAIVSEPAYPVVGENAHITVTVSNNGDTAATNVQVRLSFNDWGVTFFGWQEIGTVTIPSIAAGGTADAEFDYVFENRAHTCLEALIVGADDNTSVDDDRGQINLEVINTGETFDYWVPIVNNGDQPLVLELMECIERADGTVGDPNGACRPPMERIPPLAPGEEHLFPVHIENIAPGEEIVYILEAVDVANPNHRNHIRLEIRGSTARGLKTMARGMLAAVADGKSGGVRGKLNSAIRNLDNALASGKWDGDNGVKKAGGESVFAAELAAINTLLGVLDDGLTPADSDAINEAILKLVDADRILAASATPGNAGADLLISDGDDQRLAGDYHAAVSSYKHAWKAAQK
jgi:hypothetical protein